MVVVYIQKEDLYVANLGDSEAVMGNKKDDGTFSAFLVSKKHKPGSYCLWAQGRSHALTLFL